LRHFLLFLITLSFSLLVSAQVKKPWNDPGYDDKLVHFGFSVGVNSMDLAFKRTNKADVQENPVLIPDVNKLHPGFQVQIVSNLRLAEDLDLRFLPGISFGSRTISFYDLKETETSKKPVLSGTVDLDNNYLDFPLNLKYRSRRLNNYRPYIIGGFNYRYDMAARKQDVFRLKPGDLYAELGVGIDFYLPYFKLSTEMKVGMGLFDLLIRDPKSNQNYLASIEKVNAYIIGFSFHFE